MLDTPSELVRSAQLQQRAARVFMHRATHAAEQFVERAGEAIKESFRLLMHLVHPDRQDERVVWPESYAALANRA